MCFFTSQHMQAEDIARKYGRRTDRVDAARLMLADKEHEARLSADTGGRTAIYDYRLNEGMYVSPAYAAPYTVIVNGSDQLQVMRWGLVPHSATLTEKERYEREHMYKNAQAEHLFTSWPWRKLWRQRRCIIPVTGFFEPHYDESGLSRPYYIQRTDGGLSSIAGLYDEWPDTENGNTLLSFVMITISANPMLREIHNGGAHPFRMPLILPDERAEGWLDSSTERQEEVERYLVTPDDKDFEAWPVGKRFNYGDPYDPAKTEREEIRTPKQAFIF